MIRVFIGTHEMHAKAEKVLEYSILKHASEPVEINFMRYSWGTPPTGFSSYRYMIPQLCNYEGYAIYLDVDMLLLADIKELWNYQTPGCWCITPMRGKQGVRDEVSVIDCSAFKDLPPVKRLRKPDGKVLAKSTVGKRYLANIPETWNMKILSCCSKDTCALRGQTPPNPKPDAKLIHYTRLQTQPWRPDPKINYLPFRCQMTEGLFWQYLEEAENQ